MIDRLPKKPGRVELAYDDGTKVQVTITRKDEPVETGMALNKANLLPDSVCDALGLDSVTATPGVALRKCNDFWAGTKVWKSIVPIRGTTYNWPGASSRFTLIGNVLCTVSGSTMTALRCLNVDTLTQYTVGDDRYDSINGAFAYDGTALYVFGHGSSSEKKLYKVRLYADSGNVSMIWSDPSSFDSSLLYVNDAYLIGASRIGNDQLAWIWDKNGNVLGYTTCKYCYEGFMIRNYLYTCDGATVYRMYFNGSSFSNETSVAFPSGVGLISGVDNYAQDKTFYGFDAANLILYKITAASMTVKVAFDFSKYIEVYADTEKSPYLRMSQKRYYCKAYGILYVFDRGTGRMIGKSKPRFIVPEYMLSNMKNEEIGIAPYTILKLAEEYDPLIVER